MHEDDGTWIVFDFFGTLFDISSISRKISSQGGIVNPVEFLNVWRGKQLEYSYLLSLIGKYESFTRVTESALRYTASLLASDLTENDLSGLMECWFRPTLYPEVENVLDELYGSRTAILSNGDRQMLSRGIEHAGLKWKFHSVLSAEDARVFKPDPRVYRLASESLNADPSKILFVSSNGWDIAGSAAFGFRTAWVNREGKPEETLDFRPHHAVKDLNGILQFIS